MAIAVIGGLIVSTVLSLLFVPALFAVMDDLGGLIWRMSSRFIVSSEEPAASVAESAPPPGEPGKERWAGAGAGAGAGKAAEAPRLAGPA